MPMWGIREFMWLGCLNVQFREFDGQIYVFKAIVKYRELLGIKIKLSFCSLNVFASIKFWFFESRCNAAEIF